MHAREISRSRYLVARSREAPASAKHLIETALQTIRDSQHLVERAKQTCNNPMIGSAGPSKQNRNTDKE